MALALVLSPFADALLNVVRDAVGLRSRKAAFGVICAVLGGAASVVLVGRTLAWA